MTDPRGYLGNAPVKAPIAISASPMENPGSVQDKILLYLFKDLF